jgi:hypothetical protein
MDEKGARMSEVVWRRAHRIAAAGLLLLGLLHTALTPTVYSGRPLERVWFGGTGLFLVSVGMQNWLATATGSRSRGVLWVAAGLNAGGLALALWALPLFLGEPQGYVLVVLFLLATLSTLHSLWAGRREAAKDLPAGHKVGG